MSLSNSTPYLIENISVDRAGRQRQESADFDVSDLIHSFRTIGLLNPIIIERGGNLRAGERRLTAAKQLGWTHIDVRFVEDLDATELHLLELDENLRRKNLTWQDECRAVQEYHRLRGELTPGWTASQTADALGLSGNTISNYLDVARELSAGNEKVVAADKFSQARTITEKVNARRRAATVERALVEASAPRTAPIVCADFHEWAADYRGEPFNFLHCDFPYGVNMTDTSQGAAYAVHGTYADSANVYWELLETLKEHQSKLIASSAHIMFWFSMDFYQDTKDFLEKALGFVVNPFPLIWHKSDNVGMMPDVKRQGRRIYETAFFGARGDRFIIDAVSNLFSHPARDKEIHMSEKPLPMLRHFLRMFCDEYTTCLDPTCGSGNALRAASQLGARVVLGLERDAEFARLATDHFFDE